jgi:hypothetical protein
MSVTLKSNTGNGEFVNGEFISFSYSEEVSSLDPSALTGGTGDVSFSAEAITDVIKDGINSHSLLLLNNDIVLSVEDLGDVAFSVKTVNTNDYTVSASGPTTQSKINVSKTALHFTGTLRGAIDYYCSLVGVTPGYDGSLAADLAAVNVAFIGWQDSVWNKLKELLSVHRAYDATRITTTGSVRNDGYYPFEMYVESATNTIRFREAANQTIFLAETLTSKSFSVDSFDGSQSVEVFGYNTTTVAPDLTLTNIYTEPVYDVKNYDKDADPATTFKSSVDMSGVTVNANETADRLFNIDTFITNLAQPKCVSSISRLPYRKAAGSVFRVEHTSTTSTFKIYTADVGYENTPATGETVTLSGVVTFGGTIPDGTYTVSNSSQSERWFEFVLATGWPSFNYLATAGIYESASAVGEYVIVGDGDIPIQPAEWVAQGGNVTVALTDIPGEIKVTITAPKTDALPSADDPNKYVNGPFQIGVEVAGDAKYPAFWILATGVAFAKDSVVFSTGIEPSYTSKDSSTAVDNIFITTTKLRNDVAMVAAQAACGPKVSMSASSTELLPFGTMLGMISQEAGNNYRIQSVSHDGYMSGIAATPYVTMMDFNAAHSGFTFTDFDNKNQTLRFNEFTIMPLIGAV